MKNENLTMQSSLGALKKRFSPWFLAARPKTWVASIAPVLIGGFFAAPLNWALFACTLAFSLLIQIGTNFANDYYDFFYGADLEERTGPARAVSSGWISAVSMKFGFCLCFLAAFAVSIPLVRSCGLWSILIVLSSIAFGFLYTGGPKPLAYLGLGEFFVILYFGVIPVIGTYFVHRQTIFPEIIYWSFVPGLLSTAILIANNLRDEEGDRKVSKKTLVVRFGKTFGAIEYSLSLLIGVLIPVFLGHTHFLFTLIATIPLIKKAFSGKNLAPLLPQTALFFLLFTLLILCSQ